MHGLLHEFMITLLRCSVVLSVIILLYLAVTPLLAQRYSAKGLYYGWLVIVLGLIIPFRPQFETRLIKVEAPLEAILTSPMPNSQIWADNRIGDMAAAPLNAAPVSPALSAIEWWPFITAVWLAGVVVFLVYQGIKHCRFVRMTDRWSENIADEQTLILLQKLKGELGISRQIKLYLCACIGSPMLTGLINPRILLPMTEFSEDELRFILKHELVHYKRKDLWYKSFKLVATAMHWFNPTVYLMARAIDAQCEFSCDAEVVQNTDADTRKQYSKTIIGMARHHSTLQTALSTNFYGGKKGMKNRISSIMNAQKKKLGLTVVCIALMMTLGVGLVKWDSGSTLSAANSGSDVTVRLAGDSVFGKGYGTYVSNVESRPMLEFYIEGEDIARIEVTSDTEYLYAVDWTGTQQQTGRDEGLGSDKVITFDFEEGFSDYEDIWYRWTARNLYEWAAADDFSGILLPSKPLTKQEFDDLTEEEKLALASGNDGTGTTGLGHIQLQGYPEELTVDSITITVTDRLGNSTVKIIDVQISNNELNQTVVTASVRD